jgi:predicted nucleotidyltransferase
MVQIWFNEEYEIFDYLLKSKKAHGRKISQELNLSLSTTQRNLNTLEEKKLISFDAIGRNKEYKIKNNLFTRYYINNVESYNTIKLFEKYPKLKPIIQDILNYLKGIDSIVILFGSYAKSNATNSSDIDIYVETNDKLLKEKIELINSKISVKIGTLGNDPLSKEIEKHKIILKGVEKYYEKFD